MEFGFAEDCALGLRGEGGEFDEGCVADCCRVLSLVRGEGKIDRRSADGGMVYIPPVRLSTTPCAEETFWWYDIMGSDMVEAERDMRGIRRLAVARRGVARRGVARRGVAMRREVRRVRMRIELYRCSLRKGPTTATKMVLGYCLLARQARWRQRCISAQRRLNAPLSLVCYMPLDLGRNDSTD